MQQGKRDRLAACLEAAGFRVLPSAGSISSSPTTGLAGAGRWHQGGGPRLHAYPDGMAVEIDDGTVYEPDALVRCGEPLNDDMVKII